MKILGVELQKDGSRKNRLSTTTAAYMYEVCDCGTPGPVRFYARVSRIVGTMSHAAYGESERAAIDALHEKMQFAANELEELLRPLRSE